MISRLLAQATEDHSVANVFMYLFDDDGPEVCLKSPSYYIGRRYDQPVDFLSITAAAALKREVAIGFVKQGVICLNPDQGKPVTLTSKDKIVVISFHEGEYL